MHTIVKKSKIIDQQGITTKLIVAFCSVMAVVFTGYIFIGYDCIHAMYSSGLLKIFDSVTKIGNHEDPSRYYYVLGLKVNAVITVLGLLGIPYYIDSHAVIEWLGKKYKVIIFGALVVFSIYVGSKFDFRGFVTAPVIQDDYILHFVDAHEEVAHWKNNFRLWGYNPFFCAGKLSFGIDTFWPFIFMTFLSGVGLSAFSFNLSILCAFFIPPVLGFLTAKNFGIGGFGMVFYTVGTMAMAADFPPLREFYFFGCNGFVVASSMCIYLLSIVYLFINNPKPKYIPLMIVWGSIAILVHPLSTVVFTCLFLPFVIFYWKELTWKKITTFAISAVVVLGINTIWMVPYFTLSDFSGGFFATNMQTNVSLFWTTLLEYRAFTTLLIMFAISVIAFSGEILKLRESKRNELFRKNRTDKIDAKQSDAAAANSANLKSNEKVVIGGFHHRVMMNSGIDNIDNWKRNYAIAGAFVSFFPISFLGTQIGLSGLEPSRFIIPMSLSMLLAVTLYSENGFRYKKTAFIVSFIIWTLCLLPTHYSFTFGYSEYPLANEIIETLQKRKLRNSRLLIQDSNEHPYFFSHFAAYVPYVTKMETTANVYPLVAPRFSQFVDGWLFGRPMQELPADELENYLELYNIGYVLVFTNYGRAYFDNIECMEKMYSGGTFTIYQNTTNEQNFCYQSKARVRADYDSIIVQTAENETTILKYHYYESLKIEPSALVLEPVYLYDDPVPFISVKNGDIKNFVIYN